MRAAVVYESMYGNTRTIAEAVVEGLVAGGVNAQAMRVSRIEPDQLTDVDLVVLGAPTHAWGMSRSSTRRTAADAAAKPDSGLSLEPDATGPGMREWLAGGPRLPEHVAVFDTRMHAPLHLSGSAASRMRSTLRKHGASAVPRPQAFYVSRRHELIAGEAARARRWGEQLAGSVATHAA